MSIAKKTLCLILALVFVYSLSGCATARRSKDLEVQGLRNQIALLENRLLSKEAEISRLNSELEARKMRVVGEVKSRPTAKQIQLALQKAGFDPGPIDGKMGKKTRDTIKAFQQANDLEADGRVGKKTWEFLSRFLYEKVK